ncbi:MAG: phospho-sugar mutase [Lachnospiraceae bacterium]|nr:phospho-sugar mutase [Lachnospiraceae bacterium]
MTYSDTAVLWRDKLEKEDPLYAELLSVKDDNDLEDRFYKDLSFGTAGLRGKVGVGTNRMNRFTVGRAAQGIADYISKKGPDACKKGVVIAHDPRHFSAGFSKMTALILAENGIRAYTFPSLRPTPELAFMIRHLGCVSGINITASHNPREYNGFKAYWEDGCQVSSSVADGMTECIEAVDYFTGIKGMRMLDASLDEAYEKAVSEDLIIVLSEEYDRRYLDRIESLAIHKGRELDLDIPIVYTPLNGAGSIPFMTVMKDRGFTNVSIVEEQRDPDPDFTTVGYPNPEDPKAFGMSEELGKKNGAELLMATDPDADRFAIELLMDNGEYLPLNGNQTGYILVGYILDGMKDAGTLPENGAMVKSIVTSTMSSVMAESYGVKMYESLTGFKNICGLIPFLEKNYERYLFGYEESVGYAACSDIRDKDGISAGMLVAEAAAYYKKKEGKTLYQVLMGLYEKYGFYAEDEPNLVLEGIEGSKRIARMMEHVRNCPPSEIAGRKVVKLIDYKDGGEDIRHPENRIPGTNALRFFLEGADTWFAIRPSGTEPKIKFYFYTRQDSREEALNANAEIKTAVLAMIEAVK